MNEFADRYQSNQIKNAPPVNENRGPLETTIALMADHTQPFALEAPLEVDLKDLFADLRKSPVPEGVSVSFEIDETLTIVVRPNAFKRCITNLLQNACRFGTQVRVTAHRLGDNLVVSIDDDGPGIPTDMRAEVFRPFFRLDDARNQETGGSGLGLAIARDIALNHGGDIVLTESELGGLKSSVRIPL